MVVRCRSTVPSYGLFRCSHSRSLRWDQRIRTGTGGVSVTAHCPHQLARKVDILICVARLHPPNMWAYQGRVEFCAGLGRSA